MIRIDFIADKKVYRIRHSCYKCEFWNEIFIPRDILVLSEVQIKTDKEARKRIFVTSLDPKFQLKMAKSIGKVMKKMDKEEK